LQFCETKKIQGPCFCKPNYSVSKISKSLYCFLSDTLHFLNLFFSMVIRSKKYAIQTKSLPQQYTRRKAAIRLCCFGSLECSRFFNIRRNRSLIHLYRIACIKCTNKNNITTILCGFLFFNEE